MVAIALADMHDCGPKKKELKKFKGTAGTQNAVKPIISLQPRSAFNIFLSWWLRKWKNGKPLWKPTRTEISLILTGRGLKLGKNICEEERKTYVTQAEKVNSAYMKDVVAEEKNIIKVDDEADSATVGKFDQFYEDFELYETSDDGEQYYSGGFKSLNTSEWLIN